MKPIFTLSKTIRVYESSNGLAVFSLDPHLNIWERVSPWFDDDEPLYFYLLDHNFFD